jgi:hypothetical protein
MMIYHANNSEETISNPYWFFHNSKFSDDYQFPKNIYGELMELETSNSLEPIYSLNHYSLNEPIFYTKKFEDNEFILSVNEYYTFGSGTTFLSALEMLINNLEELYEDLMMDDNFTNEWLIIKEKLIERVNPNAFR